jgi:hypothetical protein
MRALIVLAVSLALAGCNGGTVDKHALTNDAATLDSISCEGALLAHDVSRGRTTGPFAREQADALRLQASNLADALAHRDALASIEQRVRAKAKDAAQVAATLKRLSEHTSDRATGTAVERSLKQMGNCP